jgi:hypothetical protein
MLFRWMLKREEALMIKREDIVTVAGVSRGIQPFTLIFVSHPLFVVLMAERGLFREGGTVCDG